MRITVKGEKFLISCLTSDYYLFDQYRLLPYFVSSAVQVCPPCYYESWTFESFECF